MMTTTMPIMAAAVILVLASVQVLSLSFAPALHRSFSFAVPVHQNTPFFRTGSTSSRISMEAGRSVTFL